MDIAPGLAAADPGVDLNPMIPVYIRLGCTNNVARIIVQREAVTTLEELALLTDDEIKSLCSIIRKPGGDVLNPAYTDAEGNPVAGEAERIADRGSNISFRAESYLKMTAYFLRYKERTSRPLLHNDVQRDAVRRLQILKRKEDEHEDVEAPKIDPKDWPRTIEGLEEYFRGCQGTTTKIPLAYVFREREDIPNYDPIEGYPTKSDELIARAPIVEMVGVPPVRQYTEEYMNDRSRVWELLSTIKKSLDCWTFVRPGQRTCVG